MKTFLRSLKINLKNAYIKNKLLKNKYMRNEYVRKNHFKMNVFTNNHYRNHKVSSFFNMELKVNLIALFRFCTIGCLFGCLLFLIYIKLFPDCTIFRFDDSFAFNKKVKLILDGSIYNLIHDLIRNPISGYLIKKRITFFFVLFLFAIIFSYKRMIGAFIFLFGTYYSFIMCLFFIRKKMAGFYDCMHLFFPHYLCYIFALLIIGSVVSDFGIYCGMKNEQFTRKKMSHLFNIFVTILAMLLGIYFEIFF